MGKDKFIIKDDDVEFSRCISCIHWTYKEGPYCKAFPDGDGIPEEILNNEVRHTKPYPDDNGIQFESVSER